MAGGDSGGPLWARVGVCAGKVSERSEAGCCVAKVARGRYSTDIFFLRMGSIISADEASRSAS